MSENAPLPQTPQTTIVEESTGVPPELSENTRTGSAIISLVSGIASIGTWFAGGVLLFLPKTLAVPAAFVIAPLQFIVPVIGIVFGVRSVRSGHAVIAGAGIALSALMLVVSLIALVYVGVGVLRKDSTSIQPPAQNGNMLVAEEFDQPNSTSGTEWTVSDPIAVRTTQSSSGIAGEPLIKVTQTAFPRVVVSYENIPASQWMMMSGASVSPQQTWAMAKLATGGSGTRTFVFPELNLIPQDGWYKIVVIDDDTELESDEFYLDTPPQPEIVRFEASPTRVTAGAAAQLSWNASDAEYCELRRYADESDGDTIESGLPLNSTYTVTPTQTTYYQLLCYGNDLEEFGYGKEKQRTFGNAAVFVQSQ